MCFFFFVVHFLPLHFLLLSSSPPLLLTSSPPLFLSSLPSLLQTPSWSRQLFAANKVEKKKWVRVIRANIRGIQRRAKKGKKGRRFSPCPFFFFTNALCLVYISFPHTHTGGHRFKSFAPPRRGVHAQWFVNGSEYFQALLPVLAKAKHRIFIADW